MRLAVALPCTFPVVYGFAEMRLPRHIWLLLATLLGVTALMLAPAAMAHGGHHGDHGRQHSASASEKAVSFLHHVESGSHELAFGSASEHSNHARHHAVCCVAGPACPACLALIAEADLGTARRRAVSIPPASQLPLPSYVIETLPRPPKSA